MSTLNICAYIGLPLTVEQTIQREVTEMGENLGYMLDSLRSLTGSGDNDSVERAEYSSTVSAVYYS